jgi:CheY-like chemotaxis protein
MAKVLVVDDHQDSREVLVLMLEMNGHKANGCESGEAAMAELELGCPDVMVLDDRMAGMSGVEVVRQVRKDSRFKGLFLIVWSADEFSEKKALEGGANDFWIKGSDAMMQSIEQLEGRVAAWRESTQNGPASGV